LSSFIYIVSKYTYYVLIYVFLNKHSAVVITSRSGKEANREKVGFFSGVITENLTWINRYRASEYLWKNNFRLKKGEETIGEKIEHLFW